MRDCTSALEAEVMDSYIYLTFYYNKRNIYFGTNDIIKD